MNKVQLTGRLTAEPEVKYTDAQMCVARMRLAVPRRFRRDGQPEADFFNLTALGRQGEFAEKYFHKGMKVEIVGRLETDTYTNREGNRVTQTTVIVEEQDFGESKGAQAGGTQMPAQAQKTTDSDGFMAIPDDVSDDGLPFN